MLESIDIWNVVGVLFFMLLGVIMCDELNDRFKRIPFGPTRIPIIGNLLQIYWYDRKYLYKALTKMAEVHGNTMKCWLGLVGSVVISGVERIQHILRNDEWVGEQDEIWILDRTRKFRATTVRENADSIRVWASVRLYANHILKDYGFGKYSTVDAVMRNKCGDLRGLIQYWKDNNRGKDIDVTKNFFLPFSLGINWAFITGENVNVEEYPILQQLLKLIKQWEQLTISTSKYLDNWPNFCDWTPAKNDYAMLSTVNSQIREILQNLIGEYRAKGNYRTKPTNLIEKFLEKIDEKEATPEKDQDCSEVVFSDNALISALFNLLVPSTLVLQSTLNYACFFLGQYPQVQEKLRGEINKVKSRVVSDLSSTDFFLMPYLSAFVLEVYRMGNVIPIEKRKMLKTVREKDTRVTRGMTLIINYDSANFHKDTWNEPMTFFPERFLDMSNNAVINEDNLLAVVAAKRLCIGEVFSKPIIMHSVNTLVQHFNFSTSSSDNSTGCLQPEWGIINNPPNYLLKINESY